MIIISKKSIDVNLKNNITIYQNMDIKEFKKTYIDARRQYEDKCLDIIRKMDIYSSNPTIRGDVKVQICDPIGYYVLL